MLLLDEATRRLVALASRGYGESGIGAEVPVGDGIIGTAARDRQVLRFNVLDSDLAYGRAIRREASSDHTCEDIKLPGLPDARSVLAIPLIVGDRVVGVLAAESRDPMAFGEWHEAYLQIIGNQIALGIDRMAERTSADAEAEPVARPVQAPPKPAAQKARTRTLTYYKKDEAIFVDGEYLIRNIPARILWKLLGESRRSGRTEFTNREVRLDEALGIARRQRQLRKPSHTPAASAAGKMSRRADRVHRPRTFCPPDRRVDRNDRALVRRPLVSPKSSRWRSASSVVRF